MPRVTAEKSRNHYSKAFTAWEGDTRVDMCVACDTDEGWVEIVQRRPPGEQWGTPFKTIRRTGNFHLRWVAGIPDHVKAEYRAMMPADLATHLDANPPGAAGDVRQRS